MIKSIIKEIEVKIEQKIKNFKKSINVKVDEITKEYLSRKYSQEG